MRAVSVSPCFYRSNTPLIPFLYRYALCGEHSTSSGPLRQIRRTSCLVLFCTEAFSPQSSTWCLESGTQRPVSSLTHISGRARLTGPKGVDYWDVLNWLNIISLAAMQGESHTLPQRSHSLKRKVQTTGIMIQRVTSMYHGRKAIVIALYGFFACHFLVSTISTGIISSHVECGMYSPCSGLLCSCALLTEGYWPRLASRYYGPTIRVCTPTTGILPKYTGMQWIISTVFDAVILGLSLNKGLQHYRAVRHNGGRANESGRQRSGLLRTLTWKGRPGTLIEILLRDSMLFPVL